MTQYRIGIGLGHRNRRDRLIVKVEEVSVTFLAEHRDLAEIYNIFSMTAYERASREALFYCFKTAPQDILLQITLAVGVPYLDVVVV